MFPSLAVLKLGAVISCVRCARQSCLQPREWPTPLASSVVLYISLFLLAVSGSAWAQNRTAGGAGIIRYHLGDYPGWAARSIDEAAWPVAAHGEVPSAAGRGDSFLWVRMGVPMPGNLRRPLALRLTGLARQQMAWQVFVENEPVGCQGTVPPFASVEAAHA